MAINEKTRQDLDVVIRNVGNALRGSSIQIKDLSHTIGLLNDAFLTSMGYDAGEITVIRNFATALDQVSTAVDGNQTVFKNTGSILVT